MCSHHLVPVRPGCPGVLHVSSSSPHPAPHFHTAGLPGVRTAGRTGGNVQGKPPSPHAGPVGGLHCREKVQAPFAHCTRPHWLSKGPQLPAALLIPPASNTQARLSSSHSSEPLTTSQLRSSSHACPSPPPQLSCPPSPSQAPQRPTH